MTAPADRSPMGPRQLLPDLPLTPPPDVLAALERYEQSAGSPLRPVHGMALADVVTRWLRPPD